MTVPVFVTPERITTTWLAQGAGLKHKGDWRGGKQSVLDATAACNEVMVTLGEEK